MATVQRIKDTFARFDTIYAHLLLVDILGRPTTDIIHYQHTASSWYYTYLEPIIRRNVGKNRTEGTVKAINFTTPNYYHLLVLGYVNAADVEPRRTTVVAQLMTNLKLLKYHAHLGPKLEISIPNKYDPIYPATINLSKKKDTEPWLASITDTLGETFTTIYVRH